MAMMLQTTDVEYFVEKFNQLSRTVHQDQWARMDIAAEMYRVYGADGLHVLADRTGFSYGTLRGWILTANAFPGAVRKKYPHVSPDACTAIRQGVLHFMATSPWGRAETWLKQAEEHRRTGRGVHKAMRQQRLLLQLQSNVPEQVAAARQTALQDCVRQAEQHLVDLQVAIERFNMVDAPYACVTLALTQSLYHSA